MGYSDEAIRKGTRAEYLAKLLFQNDGYSILVPDNHDSAFDFAVYKNDFQEVLRVQVKSVLLSGPYLRIRNKHGINRRYKENDYDILCGVHLDKCKAYLFRSDVVNNPENLGESITIERVDKTPLKVFNRPLPFKIYEL